MIKIADYEIHAIDTGRFRLDGGAMFGVIPKVLWSKTNPPDDKNRIELALRTLLLDDGEKRILIDTGIGTKFDKKHAKIYGIDHDRLNLDVELEKVGYAREDISDVFLTHLHFDHAGGTTYRKNGKLSLTFPKATYHVEKSHWEWAQKPSKRDKASFLGENYRLMAESGVLNLFDGDKDHLFDNTTILKVHGHTPHMSLLKIQDKSQQLLYCADLIPTASHIPLPFIMGYDLNALQTLKEKEEILLQAYQEDWILFLSTTLTAMLLKLRKLRKKTTKHEKLFTCN